MVYALNHPEDVACIAGVIPLTSIQDIINRLGSSGIDAAYGGQYDDVTDGPTHSPIKFAASLPSDLPVHLWSDLADTFTPHEVTQAFIAARPQTGLTTLPGWGHTDAAVTAATPEMIEFVHRHLGT